MKKILFILLLSGVYYSCSEGDSNASTSSIEDSLIDDVMSSEKTAKLNILIDNFNSFSTSAYNTYDYYDRAYGMDPEKTAKTNFVTIKEFVDFHITKLKDLDQAVEIDAFSGLDTYILEYRFQAENLARKVNEAYSYYEMGDFKMDNNAKGKAMHSPIVNAYASFFAVDNVLRYKTDSIQEIMEVAYLNELKNEGETMMYLVGMSLNKSSKMLAVVQSNEWESLDVKVVGIAKDEVRNYFEQLKTFKKDFPDEFSANHNMTWYYSALENFVKESNELFFRVRDKKPFSAGEKMNLGNKGSGWMVSGSVPSLLRKYNSLVDNYNRMQ